LYCDGAVVGCAVVVVAGSGGCVVVVVVVAGGGGGGVGVVSAGEYHDDFYDVDGDDVDFDHEVGHDDDQEADERDPEVWWSVEFAEELVA
jgi:hypothetical protein